MVKFRMELTPETWELTKTMSDKLQDQKVPWSIACGLMGDALQDHRIPPTEIAMALSLVMQRWENDAL